MTSPKDERSELVEGLRNEAGALSNEYGGEPQDYTCWDAADYIASLEPQAGMVRRRELDDMCAKVEADAIAGLRYIERRYGRLEGVGWDRVFDAHDALFARARELGLDEAALTPSEQGSGLREALRGPVLEATLARTNWQKYNSEQGDEVVYQAEKMASAIAAIEDALSIGGFERS